MLSKLPKLAIFGAGIILGVPAGLWLWQRLSGDGAILAAGWAVSLAALLILLDLLWRD